MVSRCLLISGVVVLALGYSLYHPLPEDIAEPWKLRGVLLTVKMVNAVVYVGSLLGIDSELNILRSIVALTASELRDPRVEIEDINLDVKFGHVHVRFYRPKTAKDQILPGLVYFHGGGWVFLSVETYDPVTSYIAAEANIAVISVDYRLAPEHKFPAAFDDCYAVVRQLILDSRKYSLDPDRIGIAGDSAGGNLAAAISWTLKEHDKVTQPIKFQGLIYPVLQSFDFLLPSYLTCSDVAPEILSSRKMVEYWLYYLQGDLEDVDKVLANQHIPETRRSEFAKYVSQKFLPQKYQSPPRKSVPSDDNVADRLSGLVLNEIASPLLAKSLKNLPPTFLVTAEYDVLRDEGFLYAHRLREAGVRLTHRHVDTGYHGFISLMNTPLEPAVTRKTLADFVHFIKSQGF